MSLFNIFNISGSALHAQSVRLNTTASNLANADSVSSSVNAVYRARQPVFETLLDDSSGGSGDDAVAGVGVAGIVESHTPLEREYRPNHPLADRDGYVWVPNVNPVEEMANMIEASKSYQTNVEVADASKQMLMRTLALGE
ncbi:flagellar basal body rod protein FlgC [Plasticicumulans acidivorans]|uniref:Flagellar basal-body rod protein FlgC n=1 Tax=Plasticicumulans acidivorans TaxID=886464 RepID=A0A317MYA4_9GAMM|nr:flagellar basal body rod protein FlgC [Plasticicumulans acidivorans]PWV63322.1 flagellar basal-body rod protein FlgC [Plasticicumulans acidivorans]